MIPPPPSSSGRGAPDVTGGAVIDDTDRHILAIACEVALASLDHVIAPSLADFLA